MISYQQIPLFNRILAILSLGLILLLVTMWSLKPLELTVPEFVQKKRDLPRNDFVQPKEIYNSLGQPYLTLSSSPPTFELPDLRNMLQYYGSNGRPDIDEGGPNPQFGLTADPLPRHLPKNGKLYLIYNTQLSPPSYVFSQENKETALWIEGAVENKEASIRVFFKNESGDIIRSPESLANFKLKEKEYQRSRIGSWEIGGLRVDGTLLTRQQAKWYGEDLFLKRHGGDEFGLLEGKQRIDFGKDESIYSVYVGEGDCLIWKGTHWQAVKPGIESRGFPMAVVTKVSERVITFDIWDEEGKHKIPLNLIRAADVAGVKDLSREFRLVGARTRKQTIVEVGGERLTLRPEDWLLMTKEGWKKLTTAQEIDDYVNRKIMGVLFIFDGVIKKEDNQVLTGTVYNQARSTVEQIEVGMMRSEPVVASSANRQIQTVPPLDPQGLNHQETSPMNTIPIMNNGL